MEQFEKVYMTKPVASKCLAHFFSAKDVPQMSVLRVKWLSAGISWSKLASQPRRQ